MSSDVVALILGGGRGSRLYPLTRHRSKPAVPIGGKYRLIDIPISNCINSGINRVFVLTQFLSVSLHNHISNTYKFDMFSGGYVELLAAQQTNETQHWYQGTADAVRQNLRYVGSDDCKEVLILSGDQIYRMNFGHMVEKHRATRADVTIAVLPVPTEQTSQFGLVKVDPQGRVTDFCEKPQSPEQRDPFAVRPDYISSQGIDPRGREYLASMGIYLFDRQKLETLLMTPPLATDFGKEVFPRCVRDGFHVQAHLFDGFWEDLGTIKSYHQVHLELAGDKPPFQFHSASDGVIYTRTRSLPPSRVEGGEFRHAILSDGCCVNAGVNIFRSIIGIRSRVGKNVTLRDVIMIGADRYQTDRERAADFAAGRPPVGVGDDCVIEGAILDKDCRIGRGARIRGGAARGDSEGENYVIRDGVIVIPRGAIVPDGAVI
ncbi:MAG: glucose-1-phosphate adenylyltransferase [Gemmataceae bacterium]|nr:glucose-1-phosphate adenylyltransferase [Gemmataceae bacterium]